MASPTLDLICCAVQFIKDSDIKPINGSEGPMRNVTPAYDSQRALLRVFNIAAIVSSCLSILGAIYILHPKKQYLPRQRSSYRAVERQRKVLTWLSVADVLACLGVLVMGSTGLADIGSIDDIASGNTGFKWTCIISTAWIQYFYVATYFWTFFYALDVNMMLRGDNRKLFRIYFIVSWVLPLFMVTGGLIGMYYSSKVPFECDPTFDAWHSLLPHYLASYVPMLVVLLVNPLLYWCSAKRVGPLLMRGSIFTDRERRIESQVRIKFFFIVLVFTICWLPNVINGCLLLHNLVEQRTTWHSYYTFNAIIWVAMAILNPLQAFLNALIYWGPGGCTRNVPSQADSDNYNYFSNNHANEPATDSGEETTPLVRQGKWMGSIRR